MLLTIEIIQQIIYSLAVALLLVYLSRLPKHSLFFSSLLFCSLLLAINLIPLYRGSSLVEILRGAIGDVSIASGCIMLAIIAKQFDFREIKPRLFAPLEKNGLIIVGSLLYLSTFSFISFDIYALGYVSQKLLIGVIIITFLLIAYDRVLGYIWFLTLVAYYFHLQASNNLWDYIYDPVLWLVLLIDAAKQLITKIR
ncbi:MAG: hypothetical protein RLZZ293_1540 [Pseudomonadota bacterium]|jgi:hypothetical protein